MAGRGLGVFSRFTSRNLIDGSLGTDTGAAGIENGAATDVFRNWTFPAHVNAIANGPLYYPYTYEEGTAGSTIVAANGIISVSGTPTYSSSAAVHGSLGASMPQATYLQYAIPSSTNGQISVYEKVATLPTAVASMLGIGLTIAGAAGGGNATSSLGVLVGTGGVIFARVGGVNTSTGVTVAVGQTFRVDLSYNASSMYLNGLAPTTATLKVFLGANSEGTVADGSATVTIDSFTAGYFTLGTNGPYGQTYQYDTLRLYTDTSNVPAPYNPGYIGWGRPLY